MPWEFDFAFADNTEEEMWEQLLAHKRTAMPYYTAEQASDPGVGLMLMFNRFAWLMNQRIRQLSLQNFLISATDRKAAMDLAYQYGKRPRPPRAATILLTFYTSGPTVVPKGTLVKKVATETSDEVIFSTLTKLVCPGSGNWDVYAKNAEEKSEVIGTSDGSVYQEFSLTYDPMIEDSIIVSVQDDNDDWTEQPNLLMSGSTDKHFWVYIDEDNEATVKFGDGVNSLVPPNGKQITAAYEVGGGEAGNVPAASVTTLVSSVPKVDSVTNKAAASTTLTTNAKKTDSTINVENTTSFIEAGTAYISDDQFTYTGKTGITLTGCSGLTYDHEKDEGVTYATTHTRGLDRETINELRVAIPIYNRIKTAAVSLTDYAILAQQHLGVAQAQSFQVGDIINVAILPIEGGYPDTALTAAVTIHLDKKRAAADVVLVVDPLYVKVDCTVEVDAIDFAPFVNVLHDEMRDLVIDYLDPLYRDENGVYANKFESSKYMAHIYSLLAPYLNKGLKNISIIRFCKASEATDKVEDVEMQANEIATYGTVAFKLKGDDIISKSGGMGVITTKGLPIIPTRGRRPMSD